MRHLVIEDEGDDCIDDQADSSGCMGKLQRKIRKHVAGWKAEKMVLCYARGCRLGDYHMACSKSHMVLDDK